jgi:phage tail protein X
LDLGAGPLSLVTALWIARPALRDTPLEWICLDRSGSALSAGKRIYEALASDTGTQPWRIKTIKGRIGDPIHGPKADLVTASNVFNESYMEARGDEGDAIAAAARREAGRLLSYTKAGGAVLVAEPGVPQAGRFISALRAELGRAGANPSLPCPHTAPCPCPGGRGPEGKKKWCHFKPQTIDAPNGHGVTETISFIFAGQNHPEFNWQIKDSAPNQVSLRILSDIISLPDNLYGRYACSEQGLALLQGTRKEMEHTNAGELVLGQPTGRDLKTGAVIVVKPR